MKHRHVLAFSALTFSALALLGACKREQPATKTVPFSDDFDRTELGSDWLASGGQWTIENGEIHTSGANNAPLFLKVALPKDVVVELDVFSETPLVDSKVELMTDGRTHQSGYVFVLGGWSNTISVIARRDEHGTDRQERKPTGVVGARWYHWRLEKKGGEVRWLIDGKPYLSFSDPEPIDGPGHDRLALNNWQNRLRFDHLRIYPYDAAPAVKTSSSAAAPSGGTPSP